MSWLLLPFAIFLVCVSHPVTTASRNHPISLESFVVADSASDKLSSGWVSEILLWLEQPNTNYANERRHSLTRVKRSVYSAVAGRRPLVGCRPVTPDFCNKFGTESRLPSLRFVDSDDGESDRGCFCCGMCLRHREPFTTHRFFKKVSPKSGESPPGPADLAILVLCPSPALVWPSQWESLPGTASPRAPPAPAFPCPSRAPGRRLGPHLPCLSVLCGMLIIAP